ARDPVTEGRGLCRIPSEAHIDDTQGRSHRHDRSRRMRWFRRIRNGRQRRGGGRGGGGGQGRRGGRGRGGAPAGAGGGRGGGPAMPYDRAILADGPVAYWAMTKFSGSEPDLTGNTHTGTYHGGTTPAATLPNADQAADFNGSSQYVSVPSSAVFSIPTTGN